jgi:hypothetical protein
MRGMRLVTYCFVNSLFEAGEVLISYLTIFTPVGTAGGVVSEDRILIDRFIAVV